MVNMLWIVTTLLAFAVGTAIGQKSVKPTVTLYCPTEENLLMTAHKSNESLTCVYIEPWKVKGNPKRKTYAI